MPTYVYAVVLPDGSDGRVFEVVQRMSDQPLTKDPESGEPVRRLITAPNLSLQWSESAGKKKLSDKNLERLGFTKYQNAGGGTFEKRAGAGPNAISAD
ncbi:MAG: FmdB family transcriptional regulator [Phycisphaerae bacterium]|nr:FmdB family transcriptional regulator [Phycisphaerae bacterium]